MTGPARALLLICGFALGLPAGACKQHPRNRGAATGPADAAPNAADAADAPLPPAVPDAARAIDAVRPALRACFADQLRRKPTPKGAVTLAIEVGRDGRVTSVTPRNREGFDDAGIACMVEGAKAAQFAPPLDGLPATVEAPFVFRSAAEANARPPIPIPSSLVPIPSSR